MFELLGLLGGGVIRLLPMLLGFLEKGRDLKYELLRMEKEADLEKLRADNYLREVTAVANAAEQGSWAQGLVEAVKAEGQRKPKSGFALLDWLSASVRPILTYWWCIVLYSANKAILVIAGWKAALPIAQFAAILLTDFDRAVIGSIIGFWFVDRALRGKAV